MKYSVLILLFFLNSCVNAQNTNITKIYKSEVIKEISNELKTRYVFPEIAEKISKNLENLLSKGHFDEFNQLEDFSKGLTECIYKVGKDKHIIVSLKRKLEATENNDDTQSNHMMARLEERTYYRRYNANFKSVEKMDDNIGYLDLRGFYGLDYGKSFADNAMAMLSSSNAIIIDLRNNSGGRGDMVDYLLSYFFDEPIITGKSLKRSGDEFIERTHMSFEGNPNKKMTKIPLFILTSSKTFSAAEAFSYPLQVYKRATFIGETTKGGANAGDLIPINDDLEIFIPDVASLPHPVSNATLEGIGVIPDIKINSSEALETTIPLAQRAAKEYKSNMDKKAEKTLKKVYQLIENYDGKDTEKIINAFLDCRKHDVIFEEWELNSMGYQFINNKKMKTALAIFKANTIIYPHSANTYDGYAYALVKNEKLHDAILNFEKAISIAETNKDKNLKIYKEHLEKAKTLKF